KAVIVIVADRDRGSPAGAPQPCLFGDIGKGAVAIVLIEAIGSAGRTLASGSAQYEDVEPAIVIVIEKSRAAAHGFENVGLVVGFAADHWRAQSGGIGNIGEARVKREAGGFTPRRRRHVPGRYTLA